MAALHHVLVADAAAGDEGVCDALCGIFRARERVEDGAYKEWG